LRVPVGLVFVLCHCFATSIFAANPTSYQNVFTKMITTIQDNNLNAFVEDGTDQFKEAMNQTGMDSICSHIVKYGTLFVI